MQNENNTKSEAKKAPAYTKQQIKEWATRDLEAALYFLGYLRSHPTALDKLADQMLEDATTGALVDVLNKDLE